jgi:hypothetical protein
VQKRVFHLPSRRHPIPPLRTGQAEETKAHTSGAMLTLT